MRLVDREQADRGLVEQAQGRGGLQPLRGQVEQVKLAGQEIGLHRRLLAAVLAGVKEASPDAERLQRVDLIVHQGDERRDHHAGARPDQRGYLVAKGLAAAGWHQHQRVAAADQVLDDLLLVTAERVVAEHPAQDAGRSAQIPVEGLRRHRASVRRHPASPAAEPEPAAIMSCQLFASAADDLIG